MKIFRNFIPQMLFNEAGENEGGASTMSQEKIEEQINKSFDDFGEEGKVINPEDLENINEGLQEQNLDGEGKANENQNNEYKIDSYWDNLKKRLSTDDKEFEIPEFIKNGKKEDGSEITEEDKFNAFVETVYKNTKYKDTEEDNFIQSYKEAKKEDNFNLQNFLKQHSEDTNFKNLNSEDKIKLHFSEQVDAENKRKYSDEDIEKFISAKSKIELDDLANNISEEREKIMKEELSKKNEKINEENEKIFKEWEKQREENLNEVINETLKFEDVGGIKVAKGEIEEFNKVFKHLMEYNPETRDLRLMDFLQSDNITLWKTLFLGHKMNSGGLQSYISSMKEELKNEFLEKTGVKPKESTSSNLGIEKPPTAEGLF